ncbi:uncharacterized protein LOC133782796 [Humulus lupulus]|uniref:uncharacterized protein LOC133782796 n=1 Tax=Humulus lupulus TaxID=3486 RepID=UPI002B41437F|nr:uncharacterized protein LOC133782796 [Humulus lupulus]XP_062078168.1 uncharacterized protein LOC133782796 [Humulus lupulus]XP_062078169.1 uncharacterized protein LOC133782796 [Humulus lupulus]
MSPKKSRALRKKEVDYTEKELGEIFSSKGFVTPRSIFSTSDLSHSVDKYGLIDELGLKVPVNDERADSPPNRFNVWSPMHCQASAFLLLHTYFVEICDYFEVAPFQLTPNSYGLLALLHILYRVLDWHPSDALEVHYFFNIKSNHASGYEGFYHLCSYSGGDVLKSGVSNLDRYFSSYFFTNAIKSEHRSFCDIGCL